MARRPSRQADQRAARHLCRELGATAAYENRKEISMRFVLGCFFASLAALLSCSKGPTNPTGELDHLLFVREGGGTKTFTVTQSSNTNTVAISVSKYEFRDTLVEFHSSSESSNGDAFLALDDALHGRVSISGDFKQPTAPTGTWAFLYVVHDSQMVEITNTDLRNRLLPFEMIVRNHFQ
jgi:hypothetical protein